VLPFLNLREYFFFVVGIFKREVEVAMKVAPMQTSGIKV
jgi:hypothetical protein